MEPDKHFAESSAKIQKCLDRSRNEQQKAVLLCEVAKTRCENDSRRALNRSENLLQASSRIQKRSQELRKKK